MDLQIVSLLKNEQVFASFQRHMKQSLSLSKPEWAAKLLEIPRSIIRALLKSCPEFAATYIDVCPEKHCCLFWGEHKNKRQCPCIFVTVLFKFLILAILLV